MFHITLFNIKFRLFHVRFKLFIISNFTLIIWYLKNQFWFHIVCINMQFVYHYQYRKCPFNASSRKDYEKFVQLVCANIIGPLFYEAKIDTLSRFYDFNICHCASTYWWNHTIYSTSYCNCSYFFNAWKILRLTGARVPLRSI